MPFEPGQYAPFPQNLLFPLRNIENLELETVNPDKRFRFDYESNDGIDDEYGDENPLGRINKDAPEVHNIWQANPVFSEKSFRNILGKLANEEESPKFRIEYDKSPHNPNFFQINIRFDIRDGVKLRHIMEAIKKVNPEKLQKAWDSQGVMIFVKGGMMLGNVSKKEYEKYLHSTNLDKTL